MALEPIGDIADVSLTAGTVTSDEPLSQSLKRQTFRFTAEQIEGASNVSARKAQVADRRQRR